MKNRTNILFTQDIYKFLKDLSTKEKKPMSAIIEEAISLVYAQEIANKRLDKLKAKLDG